MQITAFNTCGARSNRWRRQTTAGPQSHTMAMAGSATFRPLDVAGFYLGSKLYCVGPSSYFGEPKNLVIRLKARVFAKRSGQTLSNSTDFFHSRNLPPARKHFTGSWSDVAPLNLDSKISSWWLTALLQVGFSQIKREWLQDSAVPKALSALMWKSFGEPQTKDTLFIQLRRRGQMEQGKVVEDLVISYQILFVDHTKNVFWFNVITYTCFLMILCLWFFSFSFLLCDFVFWYDFQFIYIFSLCMILSRFIDILFKTFRTLYVFLHQIASC